MGKTKSFEWTEELAAKPLPPFRGEGAPVKATKPVDAVKFLGPVATSLAPQVAPKYKPRASLVTLATTGKGSFTDEADALIVLAGTGVTGKYKGQITMVGDADAKKIVDQGVDRWVHVYGLGGAVEIVALCGAWKPYSLMSSPNHTMVLARRRLRHVIAHHADYAAALAHAEKVAGGDGAKAYKSADYDGTFELLSYLFPDHRPFFDGAVAALRRAKRESRWLLASAKTTADVAAIPSIGSHDLDHHAIVIPRVAKEDGLPILIELAKEHVWNEGLALALSAYPTKVAATALAKFAEYKGTHKTLIAYFKAHPELVKEALEPATKSGDNKWLKKYATKVLAAVNK